MKQLHKAHLEYYLVLIITLLISINAIPNNGSIEDINKSIKLGDSTFESSQARSRFAQIKAIIDNHSLNIDKYSEIAFPDMAYANGHYYPTFLPGTTSLALPFYFIGKFLNLGVLFTNLLPVLSLILSAYFMQKILKLLNFSGPISRLAVFLMIFATGLYTYGTSLNAHPLSALSVILASYALMLSIRQKSPFAYPLFWFAFGLGVFLDYPNLVTLLPFAFVLFLLSLKSKQSHYYFASTAMSLIFIIPLLIYTQSVFGTVFTSVTSHELRGYINQNGQPAFVALADPKFYLNRQVIYRKPEFNPAYLPSGLLSILISPPRGLFIFTPILLLSLMGTADFLKKHRYLAYAVLSAIILTVLFYGSYLISYGGWAYGPRYLIAVTPLIIILLAFTIKKYGKSIFFKLLFLTFSILSIGISSLGALSSRNLPSPLDISPSGKSWGWGFDNSFLRGFDFLSKNHLSSYFYNQLLADKITAFGFYVFIYLILIAFFLKLTFNVYAKKK